VADSLQAEISDRPAALQAYWNSAAPAALGSARINTAKASITTASNGDYV
jgi:hypothetical protein